MADLKDDPFRSLAGELRRIGGFAKDTTPFSEFLWADFLRRNLSRKRVEADFDKALEKALALAKGKTRFTCRAGAGRRRTIDFQADGGLSVGEIRGRFRRLVLAAERAVQPALERMAGQQQQASKGKHRR